MSKLIRIEVLERFSIDGLLYLGPIPELSDEGETRFVPEEVAKTACGAGWARDLDGNIPTGLRDPSAKQLVVKPIKHEHGAKKAG